MTPLQIDMLMHIYCRHEPIENLHNPEGAQRASINWFLEEDLIEPTMDSPTAYKLRPRGSAYVQFLQWLPLPVANWSIPGPWSPSMPSPVSAPQPKEK